MECSLDSRGIDWKCDTCYRKETMGMRLTADANDDDRMSKMATLIGWYDRGLLPKEQYTTLRDDILDRNTC